MRDLLHAGSVVVVGPGTGRGRRGLDRRPAGVARAGGPPGRGPVGAWCTRSGCRETRPCRCTRGWPTCPARSSSRSSRCRRTGRPTWCAGSARLGVHGVVLLTAGFAEEGPDGLERQRALLRAAHGAGMRVVGPALLRGPRPRATAGCSSTRRWRRTPPDAGPDRAVLPVGAAVGRAARGGAPPGHRRLAVRLRRAPGGRVRQRPHAVLGGRRRAPTSSACTWSRSATRASSPGSPVASSLIKPVIVVTAGRSGQVVPPGHAVRPTHAPPRTLAEMLRQSGVVRVENTHQMLDVAQVLAHQPLPAGRRTAILASSASVAALVAEAAAAAGLVVSGHRAAARRGRPARRASGRPSTSSTRDPDSDVVVVVRDPDRRAAGHRAAGRGRARPRRAPGAPTVACIFDLHGLTPELTAADDDGREWTVPAYSTPEDAVLALGHAARYAPVARRGPGRARCTPRASTPVPRAGSSRRLARRGRATRSSRWTRPDRPSCSPRSASRSCRRSACTTPTRPSRPPTRIGWPVALKTTVPALRHRADLGGVRLDVARRGRAARRRGPGPGARGGPRAADGDAPLEVQAMAPHGSACVVRSVEDPLFGPIISFGLSGDASDLLGDVAYGVPPLTDVDVAELVRTARAAPRLFGYRGLPAARRRRARGRHRARRGARRRPARAALARAEPGGGRRARRGGARRARVERSSPGRPRGRHRGDLSEERDLCAGRRPRPSRWEDGRVPAAAPALHHDLHRAGYYPELVVDVLDVALADEEVVAHLVHPETTFDAAEVRRHVTVLVLTPTRLVVAHVDDHPADSEHPSAVRLGDHRGRAAGRAARRSR